MTPKVIKSEHNMESNTQSRNHANIKHSNRKNTNKGKGGRQTVQNSKKSKPGQFAQIDKQRFKAVSVVHNLNNMRRVIGRALDRAQSNIQKMDRLLIQLSSLPLIQPDEQSEGDSEQQSEDDSEQQSEDDPAEEQHAMAESVASMLSIKTTPKHATSGSTLEQSNDSAPATPALARSPSDVPNDIEDHNSTLGKKQTFSEYYEEYSKLHEELSAANPKANDARVARLKKMDEQILKMKASAGRTWF